MQFWKVVIVLLAFLFGYVVRNTPPEVKLHRWRVAGATIAGSLSNAMVWMDVNLFGTSEAVALRKVFSGGGSLREWIFESKESLSARLNIKLEYRRVNGVKVLITTPRGLATKYDNTALVYFHGGGWATGDIDMFRVVTATYANITNAVVISVEYRLAPENPYPAGFNDCVGVTQYVLSHPDEFGIDSRKVVVGGDSAGGNFAAAVSQYLVDNNTESPLKGLVLLYPAVQLVEQTLPSRRTMNLGLLDYKKFTIFYASYMGLSEFENHGEVVMSNRAVCPEVWSDPRLKHLDLSVIPSKYRNESFQLSRPKTCNRLMYEKIKDKLFDPYISPLFASNVSQHPPTLIIAAEVDLIRDDSFLYAHRLQKAGVDVTLRLYDGAIHAFAHTMVGGIFNPTQYRMFEEDLADWFNQIQR